ncbi:MAG TPA: hypothetical protein VL974_01030 [Magnetospirillum sp.]|jgi:hypothetical protein|nr:hypothetical protein [Magnetospirillum sp.]
MKLFGAALAAAMAIASVPAWAGTQTCNGRVVPPDARKCPDGSIPMYHADIITPNQPARPQNQPQQPAAGAQSLFGVWHTAVPGGVWQTPSAVPGWDTLHIAPGVRSGDLTIAPNGRYVWNSYGGKSGRWEMGDGEYPIVLIDQVEHKRWRVGPDRRSNGRIYIWDGFVSYVGTR